MLTTLRTPCRYINARILHTDPSTLLSWRKAIVANNRLVNALVHTLEFDDVEDVAVDHSGSVESIPTAIKDNICTKSMPTTCSSKMLQDFTSPFDASVVELLRKAGHILVGKANCDEFGMGCVATFIICDLILKVF